MVVARRSTAGAALPGLPRAICDPGPDCVTGAAGSQVAGGFDMGSFRTVHALPSAVDTLKSSPPNVLRLRAATTPW